MTPDLKSGDILIIPRTRSKRKIPKRFGPELNSRWRISTRWSKRHSSTIVRPSEHCPTVMLRRLVSDYYNRRIHSLLRVRRELDNLYKQTSKIYDALLLTKDKESLIQSAEGIANDLQTYLVVATLRKMLLVTISIWTNTTRPYCINDYISQPLCMSRSSNRWTGHLLW